MKTSRKIWIADLILIALIGVALAQEKPVQSLAAPKSANPQPKLVPAQEKAAFSSSGSTSDLRVVGYIEKRDRTITIKAGPKGPVYSVKTAEGKVLFENVSGEQLRAQAPELHEFIKNAVAGSDGKKKIKADARITAVN